jgi:hypothetical protein
LKVLLICQRDWANHAYLMQECLRSVGVDAKAVTTHANNRNYTTQAIRCKSKVDLNKYTSETDIIIFMHSQYIGTNVDLTSKKVIVFHTGSRARKRPGLMNKIFNPIVDMTLTAADLYNMGGKNEHYVPVPIDLVGLQPDYSFNKLVVGHFPSGTKGESIIKKVMEKFPNIDFRLDKNIVPWEDNIKRMSECDIIIEDLRQTQAGILTSGLGITALEAAALGKIVMTRLLYADKYEKDIGKLPIWITNDAKDLYYTMLYFERIGLEELIKQKQKHREWVERCHSFKAVGKHFLNLFTSLQ